MPVGKGAGTERDAKHQPKDRRGDQARSFPAYLARSRPRHLNHSEQMQTHGEEDERDEVVPVATHVTDHSSRRRRDGTNHRDDDENPDREQRGCPERPTRGHLALLTDESHNERDAGEMTWTEHDAQHAPDDGRPKRDERRAFRRRSNRNPQPLRATLAVGTRDKSVPSRLAARSLPTSPLQLKWLK